MSAELILEGFEQLSFGALGQQALLDSRDSAHPYPDQGIYELGPSFDFSKLTGLPKKSEHRQMDELGLTTLACAQLLLNRLPQLELPSRRKGVLLGTAYGSFESEERFMEQIAREGAQSASPVRFRNSVSNAVLGHLALSLNFGGASSLVSAQGLSGLHALFLAGEWLKLGLVDRVLTGVCERLPQLIRERAQLYGEPKQRQPLLDGVQLCSLRCRGPEEQGFWAYQGSSLGTFSRGSARASLEFAWERLCRKLCEPQTAWAQLLLHGPSGSGFFCPQEGLGLASEQLETWRGAPSGAPDTGALPALLNLSLGLESVHRAQTFSLLGQLEAAQLPQPSSRLLYLAVDGGGSFALSSFIFR